MLEILSQGLATAFVIVAIYGVKVMDLPAGITIMLVCAMVFIFIFALAGGLSKIKFMK